MACNGDIFTFTFFTVKIDCKLPKITKIIIIRRRRRRRKILYGSNDDILT
jgi:hypothetical protein